MAEKVYKVYYDLKYGNEKGKNRVISVRAKNQKEAKEKCRVQVMLNTRFYAYNCRFSK